MNDLNLIKIVDFNEILNFKKNITKFDLNELLPNRPKIKIIKDYIKLLPEEKKYRRLIFSFYEQDILLCLTYSIVNSSFLIKSGLNKDIVFNYLEQLGIQYKDFKNSLEKNNKRSLKKLFKDQSVLDKLIPNFKLKKVSTKLIKILKQKYTDNKICELIFYVDFSNQLEKDTVRASNSLVKLGVSLKDSLPKQPKTIREIHDSLFNHLEYENMKRKLNDYSLNQREDFLKLDGKEIIVNGENHFIHIPKTRLELLAYSKKNIFDNCIGKSDYYAMGCVEGKWSIIGVFDSKKQPKYCIQTAKYSFIQANGVSNTDIPKEIYFELSRQLTLTPEVPSDFIPVSHSFIFGYKYNPEKNSLFVMFSPKQNGDSKIYEYENINNETYEEFSKNEKKGSYLNSVIKKHSFQRVA